MEQTTCTRCHGKGRTDMPYTYVLTLRAMRKAGWVTARGLADKLKVRPTAMYNRLARLERDGYVQRRATGPRETRFGVVR